MNQIIFSNNNNNNANEKHNKKDNMKNNIIEKFKKSNFFKFQFVFCTIIALFFIIYYAYYLYDNNKKESISRKLVSNFTITNLYNSQNNYNADKINSNNNYIKDEDKFSVIGLIEINSIKISYPILSNIDEELLKIAPCKFYGPMPNEIGNMCIAGHNYNNYKFFSKLKNLNINDVINIYDLSRKKSGISCI